MLNYIIVKEKLRTCLLKSKNSRNYEYRGSGIYNN